MHPSRWRPFIAVAAVACAAAACGELAQAPQARKVAPLALALAWPGTPTASAVFGASIDSVHVGVYRQNEATAADVGFRFRAGDEELRVAVDVPLEQEVETLYVYVDLLAGQSTLFYANSQVVLRNESVPRVPPLALTYIGPGYDAVFLTVGPRGAFVLPTGTLQLTATAQNSFQAIVPAPVAWSVSDARLATITTTGLLSARGITGTVYARAVTPTGLADSVLVTIATVLP